MDNCSSQMSPTVGTAAVSYCATWTGLRLTNKDKEIKNEQQL